jgi:beta-glucosidase
MRAWLAGMILAGSTGAFAEALPVYKDPGQPLDRRVDDLVGRMTLEEKVDFVTGDKVSNLGIIGAIGVPRLDVPNFKIEHGPYAFKGWFGPHQDKEIGTYFPVSIAQASTWDTPLVERINAAMGAEMKASGGHANAGPAMNIIRDPRCGRSFEYFTEDPYLNGQIAVAHVKGLQSQKVMANLKHYACNNQEFNRHRINVKVDERTLREIYLPGFKAAIQEGGAWSVMGAYNRVNGVYCCEDPFLLTQILRNEWGFKGFVLSDWSGTRSTAASANAGLDLEMPNKKWYGEKLLAAVNAGEVSEKTIDMMTGNILRGMFWAGAFDIKPSLDKSLLITPENRAIAREASAKSMVLLKNAGGVLPFDRTQIKKIAVIGPNGEYGIHYNNGTYNGALLQGGGSAYIEPKRSDVITTYQGVQAALRESAEVTFAPGCYAESGCGVIPAKYLLTPDGKSEGLLANYYNNADFTGEPAKTQVEKAIYHLWVGELPIPEAGRDRDDGSRFSVVWTGSLLAPETRDYTFEVRNESGFARLLIDGKLVVANEKGHRMDWHNTATIPLKGGKKYDIRVEYAKRGEKADFRLGWDYENAAWMNEAVALAKSSDAVILAVGLSGDIGETEAADRKSLRLFPAQEQLIKAVANANTNTVVAVIAGSAIAMKEWMNDVPAILMAWYPGQEGGNALADVVFGAVNPSAKLPITFPLSLDQYPEGFYTRGDEIEYSEGIFVGYRYFEKYDKKPLFPFGYGLSYTTFEYSNVKAVPSETNVVVTVDIKNTGTRSGAEVVQVYVHDVECSVERPVKELKAFRKVELNPGEQKTIEFSLSDDAFSFWSVKENAWIVEPGAFDLLIGSSSHDIRQKTSVDIK